MTPGVYAPLAHIHAHARGRGDDGVIADTTVPRPFDTACSRCTRARARAAKLVMVRPLQIITYIKRRDVQTIVVVTSVARIIVTRTDRERLIAIVAFVRDASPNRSLLSFPRDGRYDR